MDLQQSRILVKKINSLYNSLDLVEGQLSSIERDLMLSYLRQLYDIFTTTDGASSSPNPPAREVATPAPKHQAPPRQPEPTPEPVTPVAVQQTPPPVQQPTAPVTPPAPVQERPAPPPSRPATSSSPRQALEQLFTFKKAGDLSEKLSESPIADLNRAMSINDRLLYMNELFGRDMRALEDSLQVLNRYDNIDAARSFLISLGEQYDWGQEERIEIAQSFIRMVRRRYS